MGICVLAVRCRSRGFLRVSTIEQITANQERELRDVAGRMGWDIVKVYKDHGISGTTIRHRALVIELAARHHLPAVYAYRVFAEDSGLMSFGVNLPDLYRRAASYVDRIL
jgi:hypothetical protein